MPIQTYTITLEKRHRLTDKVSHFCFSPVDTFPAFIPGQFITVHMEAHGKSLKRSYSIANTSPNGKLEFAAGYVPNGPASELLFNMPLGETLTISGPYGRLILKDEPDVGRYFLVATSTGITPYRSMLESLDKKCQVNPSLEVVIIQGVQYKKDGLYADEFLNFQKTHKNASFYCAYSRELDAELCPHERKGHVQSVINSLSPNPDKDIVYLCGNPAMIDDTFSALKALEFDPKNIRREKYLSR
jgi:ferredoxin-NADP reductase